ncbi:hypothetical protein Cgig2_003938 [Carnegiea gigantea]|uniref:Uncharacterized protein n=1 Tax=Carnegiea gigantea TaxID=171969 RepID=A0A9Q1QF54_9CARY|nr:hypothetical protein Cgig2_003938 [Carnegiea gigantea]
MSHSESSRSLSTSLFLPLRLLCFFVAALWSQTEVEAGVFDSLLLILVARVSRLASCFLLLTATANLTRTMESAEMELKDLQRNLQDTLNSLGTEKEEEYGIPIWIILLLYSSCLEMRSKLRKMLEETAMIMIEHGKFKRKIDSEMEKLEQRKKELEKGEAGYEMKGESSDASRKWYFCMMLLNHPFHHPHDFSTLLCNDRGDEAIEKHIAELGKHIDQKHEVEFK